MRDADDVDVSEIPPYPSDWPAEKRVACYWHALFFTQMPSRSDQWYAVWKSLEREQTRRGRAVQAAQEKQ